MASNNQGIAHLAHKPGGFPVCRNQRAIVSVTRERFKLATKPCKKCAAILARWEAKEVSR